MEILNIFVDVYVKPEKNVKINHLKMNNFVIFIEKYKLYEFDSGHPHIIFHKKTFIRFINFFFTFC